MQYLMLVCGQESTDETLDDGLIDGSSIDDEPDAETEDWVTEMDRRGIRQLGERLRPTSSATTVRVRNGEVLLTDGPFAETKEQILGFDLLECADLDEALEVVAKHPCARSGLIELRPLWTS